MNIVTLSAYLNNVRRRKTRLRLVFEPVLTATEGVAYDGFTVAATGGIQPYEFYAEGLPDGLQIDDETGEVSGTPTQAGSYEVRVGVTDWRQFSETSEPFTIEVA